MSKSLKPKHYKLMNFIEFFTRQNGFPPKYDEIAEELGYGSRASVKRHLEHLRDAGLVDWVRGESRTLCVVKEEVSK